MHQSADVKPYNDHVLTIKGRKTKVIGKFIYFGSTLPTAVHIDDEVNNRNVKPVHHLAGYVEVSGNKVDSYTAEVYKAVVLPKLIDKRDLDSLLRLARLIG